MGIWERLENVIRSYIDDDDQIFRRTRRFRPWEHSDPDLDAAYEELDDYLRGNDSRGKEGGGEKTGEQVRPVPDEIRRDFAELGLGPDATAEECKEAYKKLLKVHHPDRHANHAGNLKKATEKTARVNASYGRLMAWFKS